MPVTLRNLVTQGALGLSVLAGEANLDRPITWVHGTELSDPTPFLQGGELLLTTGLTLKPDPDKCAAYVGRLGDAGVVGLGFGTGLSHGTVPSGLSEAAAAAGLPLFEVPQSTPFTAISKAVSRAVAADHYAAVRRNNEAQHILTRAATGPNGVAALIERVSRMLGAWVLLLDSAGNLDHAAPASAAAKVDLLAPDLARLRSAGTIASAGITGGSDDVFIQTIGSRSRGFLAIGRSAPLDVIDREIANTAAGLLSLALEQSRTLATSYQHLRTGLFRLMAAGQTDLTRQPAAALWGGLPEEPLNVYALAGPVAAREAAADLLEIAARRLGERMFFAEAEPYLVVLTAESHTGARWLSSLMTSVDGLRVGISETVRYETLTNGYRQATLAAEAMPGASGDSPMRFTDLAGQGLMQLLPGEQARGFAESLLAPLMHHDGDGRADLLDSLRVWLQHHGQWDPAAARLGVHRHTMRNRMRKVEQLTGRSLDAPGFRAELWFALHLLDEARPTEPE